MLYCAYSKRSQRRKKERKDQEGKRRGQKSRLITCSRDQLLGTKAQKKTQTRNQRQRQQHPLFGVRLVPIRLMSTAAVMVLALALHALRVLQRSRRLVAVAVGKVAELVLLVLPVLHRGIV